MGEPHYVEIFVTHVEEDGPLLKIYGQLDKSVAIFIEKLILMHSHLFESGTGRVLPGALTANSLCCAKYRDGMYYRAKVIDVSSAEQGFVRVDFIDYGNTDTVYVSDVRSLSGLQSSPLFSVPGQATEFIVAAILPSVEEGWIEPSVEFIKEKLCYAEFRCPVVAQFSGKRLIELYYNDVYFAESPQTDFRQYESCNTHIISAQQGISVPMANLISFLILRVLCVESRL